MPDGPIKGDVSNFADVSRTVHAPPIPRVPGFPRPGETPVDEPKLEPTPRARGRLSRLQKTLLAVGGSTLLAVTGYLGFNMMRGGAPVPPEPTPSATPATPRPSESGAPPTNSPNPTPDNTPSGEPPTEPPPTDPPNTEPPPSAEPTPDDSPSAEPPPDPWNYETVEEGMTLWNDGTLQVDDESMFLQSVDGPPEMLSIRSDEYLDTDYPRYNGVLLGHKIIDGYLIIVIGQKDSSGNRYTIASNLGRMSSDLYQPSLGIIGGKIIDSSSFSTESRSRDFFNEALGKLRGKGVLINTINETVDIQPDWSPEGREINGIINSGAIMGRRLKHWSLETRSNGLDTIPPEVKVAVKSLPTNKEEAESLQWSSTISFASRDLILSNVIDGFQ